MINLAIIGTSEISKIYIESFKKLGIKISYIYSRDINRAKNISKKFKIIGFTNNLNDILDNDLINTVVIATEPNRHLDLANEFLIKNKNVLIEKPIDIDLVKSKNFFKKFTNSKNIIDVVSQQRFNPIIIDFIAQLKTQNKSDPGFFNLNIFFKKNSDYFMNGNEWKKKFSNPIINQGVHWLDLINEVFGEIVECKSINFKFNKQIAKEDNIVAILKFENNKLVTISASTNIRNKRDYFSYNSHNFSFTYRHQFYKYLLLKPYNFWKIKHSNLIYLQCKNFVENINLNRNQRSVEKAIKNLDLAFKIMGQ